MLPSRIVAIGDIHAEDQALELVLHFARSNDADCIVATGDIVDGPGDADRCAELLQAYEVLTVSGNHDRWYLSQHKDQLHTPLYQYLRGLPATRHIESSGGPLLLCHGLLENDMNQLLPDDEGYALASNDELQSLLRTQTYRYVIGGHTHRRMLRRFGALQVINAGTLLREHEAGFALLDFAAQSLQYFEVNPGRAPKLIESQSLLLTP